MKIKLTENWPILAILLLSIFVIWPLFLPGFFSHHDNIQVIRIYEMRRCFEDLQIPCRWVANMGYGYGFPLFNYYGVFPFYIGAFFSLILGYIGAAKVLFFIPLILGGISMYFLSKELFDNKMAGFVSGVLFLFSPYRGLDAYVRGAIAESFAIAIIPLVFYFSLKLIRNYSAKYFFATAITLGIFLTNHNIMTLFFIPPFFLWIIYLLWQTGKNATWVLLSIGLGIGISSFYLVPSYFEKNLVQIQNLLESEYIPNFRAHFVTIRQLFLDRSWGYGISTWGEGDTISFQLGWPHWWLASLVTILALIKPIDRINFFSKLSKAQIRVIIILFLTLTVSLLMTHNKSAFIWEAIETLQFAQFPWRFLSVSIFTVSLLGGSFILLFEKKWHIPIVIIITLMTVFFNWQYFKPDKFFYLQDDQALLSGKEWDFQRKASIVDYLPIQAKVPKEPAPLEPIVLKGEAKINNFINRSNFWKFEVNANKESLVEIPVFDFPNWQVFINNQKVGHLLTETLGSMQVMVNPGEHTIEGRFENTLIRILANSISVISLVLLILIYVRTFRK